ncbi:MAG: site-specific integrase [Spirochaetia bacterium]
MRSTGQPVNPALKDRGRTLAERAALRFVGTAPHKIQTLAKYAEDFYVWERCTYIKRQHAKGRSFNRHWALEQRGLLVNYILPRFGDMRLDAINLPAVERWLVDLPLSGQSKNHTLYALRTILREAAAEGILARNPLEHVEPMAKNTRKRDVFSFDELRLLFPATREKLLAVWGNMKYAALFLTMASTGIREGEARALQWRHVLPDGWLLIERAVKIDGTIGPLKKRERTGEPRVVALPSRTRSALSLWHAETPYAEGDDLMFFGDSANHPLNGNTFQGVLARALMSATIERGERVLTTHSLRHTYNTALRRAIPADALLALMGHRDSRMSEHYDHPEIADRIKSLEVVRAQIEGALW